MVRWRIAHCLGADHRQETFEFLLSVVRDRGNDTCPPESVYVKYGSVRSAVEIMSYATRTECESWEYELTKAITAGFPEASGERARIARQLSEQMSLNPAQDDVPSHWADVTRRLREFGLSIGKSQ